MLFGHNAKKVLEFLDDYLRQKETIVPKKTNDLKGMEGLQHVVALRQIAEDYLVKYNYDITEIFDHLCDNYNKKGGVEKFIFYMAILKNEKFYGYKNLALIVKTLEEKKQLIEK